MSAYELEYKQLLEIIIQSENRVSHSFGAPLAVVVELGLGVGLEGQEVVPVRQEEAR